MAKKASTKTSTAIACGPMEDTKWRAQSALRTLTEAATITKDRQLMKAVKAEAREQAKALEKVVKPGKR